MIHPRLLRAYRATRYEAGGAVARVGRRSGAIDALLRGWAARDSAFIGAGNPFNRRAPDRWNARRLAVLAGYTRRVPHVAGEGRFGCWAEPHLLVAVPPARALVLARRFRQAAIVVVQRGRAPRLLALRR